MPKVDERSHISKTEAAGGLAVVLGGVVLLSVLIAPGSSVAGLLAGATISAVGCVLLYLAR